MGKNRDTKMLTGSIAIEVRERHHDGFLCTFHRQRREHGVSEEAIFPVGGRDSVAKQPAPEFNLKITAE